MKEADPSVITTTFGDHLERMAYKCDRFTRGKEKLPEGVNAHQAVVLFSLAIDERTKNLQQMGLGDFASDRLVDGFGKSLDEDLYP